MRRSSNNYPIAQASNLSIDVANEITLLEKEKPLKSPKRRIQQDNELGNLSSILNMQINEQAVTEYLSSNDWPQGLISAFIKSMKKIPIRFFILDDSGSMLTNDGHRNVKMSSGIECKMIKCSRWSELVSSITFHATLSDIASAPTEFRMLNMAEPVTIGAIKDNGKTREAFLELLVNESPGGQTPICFQIKEVVEKIKLIELQLRQNGQKACVVICTDGESTDGDLTEAMRPLEQLPVWVVVRLCTDENKIVEYWNEIDGELELEMDVLDDLAGEATEVYESQKGWLTYNESIHRFREFGAVVKEMDLLDEALLSSDQLRMVISLLLHVKSSNDIPHPDIDWEAFNTFLQKRNPDVWCPKTFKVKKAVDMSLLKKIYGQGKTSSTCSVS